ncbi:IS66 family insertion sequence element accessory protein TnpA [Paracraurococcus lichenis]|uniref:Helix-turn-helix domain-containing protein n=1 Tax=Paracraurococcus lichenis TaxID=3064888 RepID=A0ABT9EEN6_9PROT|nr:hypothetical protein [Paracraurococcus sp. LOR1-02]MDO9714673.1 hypothetical protein [Paracraurococcus sp. LOR1-02]
MQQMVLVEILAVPAEQSRGRHNPRAVKRKMSSFPTKGRAAPGARQPLHYPDHIRIVAPEGPGPEQTATPSSPPPLRPPAADRHAFWRDHVRAWRDSGLRRAAYAKAHGLAPRTFNHWIARLRQMFRRRPAVTPDRA